MRATPSVTLRVTNSIPRRGDSWLKRMPLTAYRSYDLAVVDRDPVPVDLRHAVGRAGIEGRGFPLRGLHRLAEHLGGAGLVEARAGMHQADGLEDPGHAQGGELPGEHRLVPGGGHERLGGEVVDLVGLGLLEHHCERMLVEQVGRHDLDPVQQVVDPLVAVVAGPPHHADDLVALGEQELGEVGAVLAGDPGDERFRHSLDPGRVVSCRSED